MKFFVSWTEESTVDCSATIEADNLHDARELVNCCAVKADDRETEHFEILNIEIEKIQTPKKSKIDISKPTIVIMEDDISLWTRKNNFLPANK